MIAAKVWTWPIPLPATATYAAVLVAAVAVLLVAATSRHDYRRARLGTAGAYALVGLDAAMIVAVAALAPVLVWTMAVAIPASLVRVGLTLRSLPRAIPAG
jgi:hypothetical protein